MIEHQWRPHCAIRGLPPRAAITKVDVCVAADRAALRGGVTCEANGAGSVAVVERVVPVVRRSGTPQGPVDPGDHRLQGVLDRLAIAGGYLCVPRETELVGREVGRHSSKGTGKGGDMFRHSGEDTGAIKLDNFWTFIVAILLVIGLFAAFGVSPYELGSGVNDFFKGMFGK